MTDRRGTPAGEWARDFAARRGSAGGKRPPPFTTATPPPNPLLAVVAKRVRILEAPTVSLVTGIHHFDRQAPAFDFYDECAAGIAAANLDFDLKVIALEVESGGRRTFMVGSLGALWEQLCRTTPSRRHFYEIIREGTPCHLFFDLEFYTPLMHCKEGSNGAETAPTRFNAHIDGVRLTAVLLHLVAAALSAQYGVLITDDNVLQLESSTPDKFSRHVLIRLPPPAAEPGATGRATMFHDVAHVGAFVRGLVADLQRMRAGNPLFDSLWVEKPPVPSSTLDLDSSTSSVGCTIEGGGSSSSAAAGVGGFPSVPAAPREFAFLADLLVYTRNRAMRMPYSSKYGKTATLLPAANNRMGHTSGASAALAADNNPLFHPAAGADAASPLSATYNTPPTLSLEYWLHSCRSSYGQLLRVGDVAQRFREEERRIIDKFSGGGKGGSAATTSIAATAPASSHADSEPLPASSPLVGGTNLRTPPSAALEPAVAATSVPALSPLFVQVGSTTWERGIWEASFVTDCLPPHALFRLNAGMNSTFAPAAASSLSAHLQVVPSPSTSGSREASPGGSSAAATTHTESPLDPFAGIVMLHCAAAAGATSSSTSQVDASTAGAPSTSGHGGVASIAGLPLDANALAGGCSSISSSVRAPMPAGRTLCVSAEGGTRKGRWGAGGMMPLNTIQTTGRGGAPPFPLLNEWVTMLASTTDPWGAAASLERRVEAKADAIAEGLATVSGVCGGGEMASDIFGSVPLESASSTAAVSSSHSSSSAPSTTQQRGPLSSTSAGAPGVTSSGPSLPTAFIRGWSATQKQFASVSIGYLLRAGAPLGATDAAAAASALHDDTAPQRSLSNAALAVSGICIPPHPPLAATPTVTVFASITYEIGGNRFCHRVGRQHRSNTVQWRLDLEAGRASQWCWDGECRRGGGGVAGLDIPLRLLPQQLPEGVALRSTGPLSSGLT